MKQKVMISLNTGVYGEWNGIMSIQVDEDLGSLINRIRVNQRNGTTIMQIESPNSSIKAINIDYITDIWVNEVE